MSILLHPPHPYILSLVQFVESIIVLLDCEFQLTTYILLSPKHFTVDVFAIIRMLWRNYVWHEGTVPAFSPLIKNPSNLTFWSYEWFVSSSLNHKSTAYWEIRQDCSSRFSVCWWVGDQQKALKQKGKH